MKIFNGTPGFGRKLTNEEISEFLARSKKNLQLGTIDSRNEPNIHPVWFFYENGLIYCATEKKSKKFQNILKNNLVYFSIDEDNLEYKGVRGKGTVRNVEDLEFSLAISEKILKKYTGNIENDFAKEILDEIKNGIETVVEIKPKFFSTWLFTI